MSTQSMIERILADLKASAFHQDALILTSYVKAQENRIKELKAALSLMLQQFDGATETQDQLDAVQKARKQVQS
jgi:hypothetical protein